MVTESSAPQSSVGRRILWKSTLLRLRALGARANRPTWRTAVVAVLVLLCFWRFWHLRAAGNWDFRVYYWAAKAQRVGLDPYNLQDLSRVAEQRVVLPYLYPPTLLYLLRPLTWFPLGIAIAVYVVLKVACVAGLILIWKACLDLRDSLALFLLVIFGFSDAVFNDLFSGNVATFEALVLWLAILCFLRGASVLFAFLVVCASIAKLTPLFFLPLVLLGSDRRRFRIFISMALVGLVLPIVSFGGNLSRLGKYLRMIGDVDERGPTNSAILPLLRDVHEHLAKRGAALTIVSPTAVYVGISLVVLSVTVVALVRTMRSPDHDREVLRERAMGMVILYSFLLPRFKDYSYCLLLPVVVFIGRRMKNALPLLVFVVSLTTRNTLARYSLGDFPLADLVWRYFNLVLICILWLGFISYIWARDHSRLVQECPSCTPNLSVAPDL